MLENLDSIDWAKLESAHGSARNIPTWIRHLRSDKPAIREFARRYLFNAINHQGSIYEASPYAVPFLIELLAAPDTAEKVAILDCLVDMSYSSKGQAVIGYYGGGEKQTQEYLQATMDLYWSFLDDPDATMRSTAFSMIVSIRPVFGIARDTLERLIKAASKETDPDTQESMIRHLRRIIKPEVEWYEPRLRECEPFIEDLLVPLLAPERPPRLRLLAAIEILRFHGEIRPDHAAIITDILRDVLLHPEAYSRDDNGPSVQSEMLTVIECLEFLPRARRLVLLAEALTAAHYAGDAHIIGYALLETIFFGTVRAGSPYESGKRSEAVPLLYQKWADRNDPIDRPDNSDAPFRGDGTIAPLDEVRKSGRFYRSSPPPADLTALSAEERRLLRLVLDTNLVWMVHSNLLEAYGLPVHRDEARALLDAAEAG